MKRLSRSIFEFDGCAVRYDRSTTYLACTCFVFTSEGKCDHIPPVKEILVSEGTAVKMRRVPKPIFIEEISRFSESAEKVLCL